MVETPKLFSVLGLPIHLIDDYTLWLKSRLQEGIGTHVVTLNAEMSILAETHPTLAKIIHQADLVIPDGAGVVLYLQMHGKKVNRCPGIELAESLLQEAQNLRVFFYGGAPGVAATAARAWQEKLPNLNIVGVQNGFTQPAEAEQLQQTLKELQPQLIFVGLGVPRQELWIAENRALCPQATWIGVGGSFDIWAGVKTRAPGWLANNHLEWLYRLYQEPWRWRRMLALPVFARKAIVYRFTQNGSMSHPLPKV
ncbi:WecB/TagA/CpsF family glycosyltransferase [Aliterella atlantica]|uniref:UDP-N-acetyl-D-mannosaminuronic acid transferase n=1 Tax=Aliterella atlantica CENA595 TaxID=1618023 RepID=A0A0D8ZNV5_9CYAN|nr:WecB/TagA/CpsF family glycosyltransferase [Aliterella atlantica]KJH70498.1 UDP-N-acetyl-D-mannosaminuronic acid transferase [Aliterella atlantica CENA595]